MQTFLEFCENQQASPQKEKLVQTIVESEFDPWGLCLEIARRQGTEVELAYLEQLNDREQLLAEFWGSLWRGAKRMGQGMGQAASTMGKGMYDKAGALAGDAAAGIRQMGDAMSGPVAKGEEAKIAVQALMDALSKNPQIDQAITNRGGTSLIQQLGTMQQTLDSILKSLPELSGQRGSATGASTQMQQGGRTTAAGPMQGGTQWGNPNAGQAAPMSGGMSSGGP